MAKRTEKVWLTVSALPLMDIYIAENKRMIVNRIKKERDDYMKIITINERNSGKERKGHTREDERCS